MDKDQALKRLAECLRYGTEVAHGIADDVLCEFLRKLGHDDIVDAWEKVHKWYA